MGYVRLAVCCCARMRPCERAALGACQTIQLLPGIPWHWPLLVGASFILPRNSDAASFNVRCVTCVGYNSYADLNTLELDPSAACNLKRQYNVLLNPFCVHQTHQPQFITSGHSCHTPASHHTLHPCLTLFASLFPLEGFMGMTCSALGSPCRS